MALPLHAFLAPRIVSFDANQHLVAWERHALLFGEKVLDIVEQSAIPQEAIVIRENDCVVTPSLVDAHTHLAWAGSRHDEYEIRMRGGDYEEIARAGGGIVSTQRSIASTSESELEHLLRSRLRTAATLGTGAVEIKSGYGLLPEEELKQLRAIHAVANDPALPKVFPTYLALHSIPKGWTGSRNEYIENVLTDTLPRVAQEKLARFVDAYVDRNAFSVEEARLVCRRAMDLGLAVRLHVGQFSDIGGAELGAELGAASCDHLEVLGERGAEAMARGGVTAGLLPTAAFTLQQAPPPIALLRKHGVPFFVASDANPGTAPTESLPLAMAFAVRSYGLTPEEALRGATTAAMRSLAGTSERHGLSPGSAADFTVWDLPHENAIVQPWGVAKARSVYRDGKAIFTRP